MYCLVFCLLCYFCKLVLVVYLFNIVKLRSLLLFFFFFCYHEIMNFLVPRNLILYRVRGQSSMIIMKYKWGFLFYDDYR